MVDAVNPEAVGVQEVPVREGLGWEGLPVGVGVGVHRTERVPLGVDVPPLRVSVDPLGDKVPADGLVLQVEV